MTKQKKIAAKPEAEDGGRKDYGIDRRTFIIAWVSSESVDEVHEKLAERAREMNLDPMPKPVILARASHYRDVGLKLPKFRPGRKVASVDEDNELIAEILAGKKVEMEKAARQASPPRVETDVVKGNVAELIKKLPGSKK